MNLKNAILYRYNNNLKMFGLFIVLITAIDLAIVISSKLFNMSGFVGNFISLTFFVVIGFFLVLGMISYEAPLRFYLQNGLTRQNAHLSFLASLPICLIGSLFERIITIVVCRVSYGKFEYKEMESYTNALATYNSSFLKDVLLGALLFMTIMSLGYFINVILKSVRPLALIIVGVVIAALIGVDMALFITQIKMAPAILWIPQIFFRGSTLGESIVSHFVASLIILTVAMLSVAHIITLCLPLKKKEA